MDDFVKRARAPIEHLSNVHKWCDSEWCWAKSLTETQNKMMSHVRESYKQYLQVCLPCTDDLVSGATIANGDITTPSATVINGDTSVPNPIADNNIINGDATICHDLVTGAPVVNGDTPSASGPKCDTSSIICNDLVADSAIINGAATISHDLVAGVLVVNERP